MSRIAMTFLFRKFLFARNGNLGLMTALLIAPIIAAAGAAIDFGFATRSQGKLEQAAQIASTTAAAATRNVVNGYASPTIAATSTHDAEATAEGRRVGLASFLAQTALLPNVAIDPSSVTMTVTRTSNTISATLNYQAQQQTVLMKIYGVSAINLSGKGSSIIGVMDDPANNLNNNNTSGSDYVINEPWSDGGAVVTNMPTKPVYNNWYSGTGGGDNPLLSSSDSVLTNKVTGAIKVGSSTGGVAPIITKKVYFQTGDYELRYWYKSTVVYPDYEPIHICGTLETEMNWVKSGRTRTLASAFKSPPTADVISTAQTSRAGVYLNPITTNPQLTTAAPLSSSFPRPPDLASATRTDNSSYRIDICAYSSHWIERKIPITITSAGYFWLSFLAEPPTSTTTVNGFYLGPVKLCWNTCPGPSNVNSPWRPYDVTTNSPGSQLFSDSFDTPTKVDGDYFSLTSGLFSADAGYETPIDHWIAYNKVTRQFSANSALTTDYFVYGTSGPTRASPRDGAQYLRVGNSNGELTRRLLLLPGYYRVKVAAGNLAAPDPCDSTTPTPYAIDFSRQDWLSIQSKPTLAPPEFTNVASGRAPEVKGCGVMSDLVICYLATSTQFYDFVLGGSTVASVYAVPGTLYVRIRIPTYDAFSIEYMSNNLVANPAELQSSCSLNGGPAKIYAAAGGDVWPGYTTKTFDRFRITAPLP